MNNPLVLLGAYYIITRIVYTLLILQCLQWVIYFPQVSLSLTTMLSFVIVKLLDWMTTMTLVEHNFNVEDYLDEDNNKE